MAPFFVVLILFEKMLNNDILWVGIYTAKMTDVIDINLIYVNRKVPPIDKGQKPDQEHPEWNFGAEPKGIDNIDWYKE